MAKTTRKMKKSIALFVTLVLIIVLSIAALVIEIMYLLSGEVINSQKVSMGINIVTVIISLVVESYIIYLEINMLVLFIKEVRKESSKKCDEEC